jgi:hypothetical protein
MCGDIIDVGNGDLSDVGKTTITNGLYLMKEKL